MLIICQIPLGPLWSSNAVSSNAVNSMDCLSQIPIASQFVRFLSFCLNLARNNHCVNTVVLIVQDCKKYFFRPHKFSHFNPSILMDPSTFIPLGKERPTVRSCFPFPASSIQNWSLYRGWPHFSCSEKSIFEKKGLLGAFCLD